MNEPIPLLLPINETDYEEMEKRIMEKTETMVILRMEMAETLIVKLKINGNDSEIQVNVV